MHPGVARKTSVQWAFAPNHPFTRAHQVRLATRTIGGLHVTQGISHHVNVVRRQFVAFGDLQQRLAAIDTVAARGQAALAACRLCG